MEKAIIAKNVVKEFDKGRVKALRGVSLAVKPGEFVAIVGPSGSGKSTLLNMISAMDRPTSGTVVVDDIEVTDGRNLNVFRRSNIGFVFQLHNLIPSLSALENVLVPMFGIKKKKKEKIARAKELLRLVGLEKRMHHRPPLLSGGERQRVAIARALANNPPVILADEPTGDVDTKTGEHIMELLEGVRKTDGTTLVLVTHDLKLAARADRQIHIVDGRVA